MNAHFTAIEPCGKSLPRKTGPIRVYVSEPVRVANIENDRFAKVWSRGTRKFLRPRVMYSIIWLVDKNGHGLRRSDWARSWNAEKVEMKCKRCNRRKEYFNANLKCDRPKT